MNNATNDYGIIGIGSNIKPLSSIFMSIQEILKYVTIIDTSKYYETTPIAEYDFPKFINGAILIRTPMTDIELNNKVLKVVEEQLGRNRIREKSNAPRTIDLDIVYYAGTMNEEAFQQAHVAVPLYDIVRKYNFKQEIKTNLKAVLRNYNKDIRDFVPREDIEFMVRGLLGGE